MKANGQRCRATALKNADRCFFHHPDLATRRKAAQRAGGIERSKVAAVLPANLPDVPLTTVQDVIVLLGATINQVRKGQVDPRISNAVGYLAGIMLKAMEQGPIEERLAILEEIVKHKSPTVAGRSKFDVDPAELDEEQDVA
jgi:hypothetical protein